MSHLIEVAFKGNRKEFYLWDGDDPPRASTPIIVEGDRGEDLGRVHATGDLAAKRYAGVSHGATLVEAAGGGPSKRALRLAVDDDLRRGEDLPEQNESARRKSMERVRAHNLVMKVTDAEWQWDRRKLTLYFTAEKRVDFRNLVRDLASLFRTRIELKQIGVRDEAKRLGGVGRCGREYCSASWLPELRPVNLSVAKDQRLSLNPTQISGACGRLMCSLRYEHEFYVQARKRFPKEGKVLVTAKGEERVVANDIFRDRVTLRGPDGESRVVPLADLRRELATLADDRSGPSPDTMADDAAERDEREEREERDDRDERDPRESADVEGEALEGGGARAETGRAGRATARPERRNEGRPDRRVEQRREPRAAEPAAEPAAEARPTPVPVPPSAGSPAPIPAPAPDLDDEELDDGDDEGTDDGAPDGAPDGAADPSAAPSDAPRPRRRRGRRGGRRGRGGPPPAAPSSES